MAQITKPPVSLARRVAHLILKRFAQGLYAIAFLSLTTALAELIKGTLAPLIFSVGLGNLVFVVLFALVLEVVGFILVKGEASDDD